MTPRSGRARRALRRAVVALVALGSAAAGAEEAPVWKPAETADAVLMLENVSWSRYLHDALGLPDWIDVAVEQRTRFEFLAEPFRPGEPDTQGQFPQRTRLRVGLDGPHGLRALVELQDARVWDDGRYDYTRNEIDELDVLQLFVSATSRDLLGSGLRADAHVGRFTLDVGSRRLVARNSFRNTTNAFDGVHLQLGRGDLRWRVRAFATWPVERKQGYFDDDVTSHQRFWGLVYEDLRTSWLQFDAYYLGLDDRPRDRSPETVGARAYRRPALAQLDYELEAMGQAGRYQGDDFSAVAAHGELGYTFESWGAPRVVAQIDYATGTEHPGGDSTHTFDPLFGARRWEFMPTGIYGPFARSNLWSPGIRLHVTPLPTVRGQVKVRVWRLADARDAFVGTGLRDPSGAAGTHLGTDVELRLQWSPTPWWSLDVGYDHWFKGSYFDRVPNAPTTDDSNYVYLETSLRF